MIKGSVKGQAELRHVQTVLTVDAPAQLRKDLLTGTREALAPLKKDIPAEALAKMPKRGGYAPLLARAVKVVTRVSGTSSVRATVRVSAAGKREGRDVSALNLGMLRHPLFGNRRHWYGQRVLRGFVDEPVDRARDRVVDSARDAAQRYADEIRRG